MIITYDEFCELLEKHIRTGQDFYDSLLINVIENPSRYCGLFRLSNAKMKLMQNVTQSNEIKFGDIIEELTTEYIEKLGYKTLEKKLGKDENGDILTVDQYFTDGNNIYIVEMKIRDDHDSTKKRGQFLNFKKKIELIKSLNKGKNVIASMWFVDDGLKKNKKYYFEEMQKEDNKSDLHLYYGKEFFSSLKGGDQAWEELTYILTEYRIENSNSDVVIPDFGTSKEVFKALVSLDQKHWDRLTSNTPQYELLRKELFAEGDNIELAKKEREKGENHYGVH